jgi:hypothetical protein
MRLVVDGDGFARFGALVGHPDLIHVVTTALGPDLGGHPSHALEHARLMDELADAAGFDGLAWAYQVHGGRVLKVARHGFAGEADALWTDRAGLGVLGRSADCPLVLLNGPSWFGGRLSGMAHASWRSTVAGITTALLDEMIGGGLAPGATVAMIAPSAGPCCYRVGAEVRDAACAGLGPDAVDWFVERGGRLYFDLWAANRDALLAAGLPPGNIHLAGICTICGEGFHSYRRDGEGAGRFAAAVATRC